MSNLHELSEEEKRSSLKFYSSKDKKWDKQKRLADKVQSIFESSQNLNKENHKRYAERMAECAKFLRFRFLDNAEESKLKLKKANFCRVRLCPICQWRRTMFWRARMFESIPKIFEKDKSIRFVFLTLTVRNVEVENLSKTIDWMNKSFTKMTKRIEFKKISKGFIKSIEVTKSKDLILNSHPHFHCLIAVKKSYFKDSVRYLSQNKWADLWKSCLKVDYTPVIDVQAVKDLTGSGDFSKAILETSKYAIKTSDMLVEPTWFLELTNQLHKKRFISTGGILKDVICDQVTDENMINTETLQDDEFNKSHEDLIFLWDKLKRHYLLEKKMNIKQNDQFNDLMSKKPFKGFSLAEIKQFLDTAKNLRNESGIDICELNGIIQLLEVEEEKLEVEEEKPKVEEEKPKVEEDKTEVKFQVRIPTGPKFK